MEMVETSGGVDGGAGKEIRLGRTLSQKDQLMVNRKNLEAMLEQFRETLELLSTTGCVDEDNQDEVEDGCADVAEQSSASDECEADKFCSLLKSRVECLDFLEKLESAQASIPQSVTEGSSWDIVSENDLWGSGDIELDKEDYVLVRQEDIVDGIACFMAAYLLSLKQTKFIFCLTGLDSQPDSRGPQQDILREEEKRKAPEGMGRKQGYI